MTVVRGPSEQSRSSPPLDRFLRGDTECYILLTFSIEVLVRVALDSNRRQRVCVGPPSSHAEIPSSSLGVPIMPSLIAQTHIAP